MEYWSILLSMVICTLGIHYLFRNYNFFKRHDVIHVPPIPILGNMTRVIFRRISMVNFICKIYNFYPDAKYFGFYATTNPIFLLRDPEIIKSVFVKNFEAFPDRRSFNDLNDPLLANNLFSLHGQKWRDVRNLLSFFFTSSNMKMMFTLMSEYAVDITNFLSTSISIEKSDMDMKDVFTKYTNDIIATCVFGIKIDSMKDPTNKFFVYGKETINFPTMKVIFLATFPTLGRIFNVKLISSHVSDFFQDIVRTIIATRDADNIIRPDMIQLMMDIRGKRGHKGLDIDDMAAQAFSFFFASLETTSTTISLVAHEIATNPDVQVKLRQEIDQILEESNGQMTFEIINQFQYLDAIIKETLRLYPAIILERVCDETYELPPALPGEKPFNMKKGMTCWIPVFAIHHDAKYYDDPEKFRPERFLDNKMYHNSSCYMPFGLGPRMCIANRFAMLKVKVVLFHLLARCELKPCAKTSMPLKFSKKSLIIKPEGGFWLNVQRRSDMNSMLESSLINGVTNF